jgi:hypothetical protein
MPQNNIIDPSNLSAFGTLETAELSYVIQGDFVYGLNTQLWGQLGAGGVTSGTGAAVDTNSGRLRIQSGTSSTSYAYISSRKSIRYRAGQGTNVRFTPIFTQGVASNISVMGVGTIASNAPYDGWFFGYNGTVFSIAHYISGTPTWYAQSTWNGNPMNGTVNGMTWNPTLGSPVMIKYPYLGFGNIFFYVENQTTGGWVLVHTVRYANTVTTPELSNPSLQFLGFTANSGNTANQIMYCGSVGISISGVQSFVSNPKWAIDSSKTGITTENCLVNIQNATSYNGIPNRGIIRLAQISGLTTSGGTNYAIIRFKLGATIGGTPSYSAVNGTPASGGATITAGNSVASYDVAGTTVSGGTYQYGFVTQNSSGSFVTDLTNAELYIAPGEIMSITAFASASATCTIAVTWTEDI